MGCHIRIGKKVAALGSCFVVGLALSLGLHSPAATAENSKIKASSFKACRDAGISVSSENTPGNNCVQVHKDQFKDLNGVMKISEISDFQMKVKDAVHTKIEFRIFETQMLKACASGDQKWLISQNVPANSIAELCQSQIAQVRDSIRTRFPEMRMNLALSSSSVRESQFSSSRSAWFKKDINYDGGIYDFKPLKPLDPSEQGRAAKIYASEVAGSILRSGGGTLRDATLNESGRVRTIKDVIAREKINHPQMSEKEALTDYFLNQPSYVINGLPGMRGLEDGIHLEYRNKYFQTMNEMPLMGYIDSVDLKDKGSPTNGQIASALKATEEKLTKYLKTLKASDASAQASKWAEYANFTPELEAILRDDPQYCGLAETLLAEKRRAERNEIYQDLGIAAVAAVPCFMAGPVAMSACVSAGVALGAKGLADASRDYSKTANRNLSDFMGEDDFANFQQLDEKKRAVVMQAVLLPVGAFGGAGTTGRMATKAVSRVYSAYDDVGRFVSKAEGLELTNKAMAKFLAKPNWEKLPLAEQEKLFDQLLADEVLPKHLLSVLENDKGGFKLLDANYDFDSFPPDVLNQISAKLGGESQAKAFLKQMYHRHVIDHHGSMGNVQNATQQVIKEYTGRYQAIKARYGDNYLAEKASLALAARDMKREFYRVSTDNLGDGQLATFLVRNHSERLMSDPQFAQFMDKVANIEDFEAFGPKIYKSFAAYEDKLAKGVALTNKESDEFRAIQVAMARQKAMNDILLKYGSDESLGGAQKALLSADRINQLPADVQKKMIAELDDMTESILSKEEVAASMAKAYVGKVQGLSGSAAAPGLVRKAELAAKDSYEGLSPAAVKVAKGEIFAFDATKLRTSFKAQTGKDLGPFEVFHAPHTVLDSQKKLVVQVTDTGEKRTFVVAFGDTLRTGNDTLVALAAEIHEVERRTLKGLIESTSDPARAKVYRQELEAVEAALANKENMSKFGGPASLMRSAADDPRIKDLVFNFNGIRSRPDDILEAVIRGRAKAAEAQQVQEAQSVRRKLFQK